MMGSVNDRVNDRVNDSAARGVGMVLEGGSLRGLFTMGILDTLDKEGITVDGCVGVSAGVAFGCNYKSHQVGRALRYNKEYCRNWHFKGWRSLILTGDLFGADFCYRELPNVLDPFDCDTFASDPMKFWAVATDCDTGLPYYHLLSDGRDLDMQWVRASASMPLASRVVNIDGGRYLDGGLSDSIPLEFMERQGYERNIVIVTRPRDYVRHAYPSAAVVALRAQGLDKVADLVRDRHIMYNQQTAFVRARESAGAALVLAPEGPLEIGSLERDPEEIQRVYDAGVKVAVENMGRIREFIG